MTDRSQTDPLTDVLDDLRFRAEVFKHADYCGEWELNTSGDAKAQFHLVGRGSGWLHLEERDPVPVKAGDLVLFPRDAWHVLTGDREQVPGRGSSSASPESMTTVLCGTFDFGVGTTNPILACLPDVLVVRSEKLANHGELESLTRVILAEAAGSGAGRQTLLDRLCEGLFVLVLRYHLDTTSDRRGFLAALADPLLRQALAAIHAEPGRRWTVEEMAQQATMSRTAFATRFREFVGLTPMRYLTDWRMRQARQRLGDRSLSVASIAESLGYDTEAAFRRAFRRTVGVTPGAVRRDPGIRRLDDRRHDGRS